MENYGILLVDDQPAYHAIVSALLEPRGGAVTGVADTAAALEAVRARQYDLILVETSMAEADGDGVAAAIRAAAEWAGTVPILAFTSDHPIGKDRYYAAAGFDGWFPKPFEAAELLMALQRRLGAERVGSIVIEPPGAELATLIGAEAAGAMIARFHAGLADAVAQIDAGADVSSPGHKLGGIAGTLGFPVLSAAWLSLQDGDGSAWPTVRKLTMEALAADRSPSS